jgi:hypothetical protein
MNTGQFVAGTLVGALARLSEQAIKDAYAALKALLKRRFADDEEVTKAIDRTEADPKKWGDTMQLHLEERADQIDDEIVNAAQALHTLLNQQGSTKNVNVTQQGDGNIAIGGNMSDSTIRSTVKKDD